MCFFFSDGSKRLKKDPGIPNLHPFKEQMLLKAEEQKRLIAEQEAQQRALRRSMQQQGVQAASELEALAVRYRLSPRPIARHAYLCTLFCVPTVERTPG